jgi:tetratricopeptide (TPR) repeat protein
MRHACLQIHRYVFAFLVAALVLCAISPELAQVAGRPSLVATAKLLRDGESRLKEGRTTLDEQVLVAARRDFTECVQMDSKSTQCFYDLARSEAYLEQVAQIQKDKKAAERWIDSAIEDAQHAIALDDGSSDAHALLADLYGNKIGLGGVFAGAHYGPKVDAEYERALQLDPNNSRVYVVMGHKYFFTPKMFGGNLDKAIESFQKATTLDSNYDEAFVWLAIAYRKKGNAQSAERALGEALHLNPRSAFAKRIQDGARE